MKNYIARIQHSPCEEKGSTTIEYMILGTLTVLLVGTYFPVLQTTIVESVSLITGSLNGTEIDRSKIQCPGMPALIPNWLSSC